jgi:hypothetical protein
MGGVWHKSASLMFGRRLREPSMPDYLASRSFFSSFSSASASRAFRGLALRHWATIGAKAARHRSASGPVGSMIDCAGSLHLTDDPRALAIEGASEAAGQLPCGDQWLASAGSRS